ncbi:hypothetical protein GCM10009551_047020 [Nocardiopsis tropica]
MTKRKGGVYRKELRSEELRRGAPGRRNMAKVSNGPDQDALVFERPLSPVGARSPRIPSHRTGTVVTVPEGP